MNGIVDIADSEAPDSHGNFNAEGGVLLNSGVMRRAAGPSGEHLHADIAKAVHQVLPQARALWLFGSAARNEMRDDSDIDLAVTLPAPLTPLEKWQVQSQLAQLLGADIDLLDFGRLPTVMQYQVIETGQLLFATDPVATETYNAFVRSEYMDIQRWRQPMIAKLTQELLHA